MVMMTLLLALFAAQTVQGVTPRASIISQLKCGDARFAVLEVSNPTGNESVFFPLSPLYTHGFTIHNIRLESEDNGKWHLLGRGSDIPGVGVRELKPGERFFDFFPMPTAEQATKLLAESHVRLAIPYKVGGKFEQIETQTFNFGNLPAGSGVACPVPLNPVSTSK
jgi:hypothetical protein